MSEEVLAEAKRLLLKEKMELDDAAEFQALHKAGFRIAFDFLNASFPPVRKEEYWKTCLERIEEKIHENPNNLLVRPLLIGVYDYLSEIVKDLPYEEGKDDN